jgi:hypothetical protein
MFLKSIFLPTVVGGVVGFLMGVTPAVPVGTKAKSMLQVYRFLVVRRLILNLQVAGKRVLALAVLKLQTVNRVGTEVTTPVSMVRRVASYSLPLAVVVVVVVAEVMGRMEQMAVDRMAMILLMLEGVRRVLVGVADSAMLVVKMVAMGHH